MVQGNPGDTAALLADKLGATAGGICCVGPTPRTAAGAYRIDRVLEVEVLQNTFSPPPDLDPVAVLEQHLALGWEYDVEVLIDAPLDTVAPCVSRAVGRLEALDAETTRLIGTTSNPVWYAQQLAAIPAA